MATRFQKLIGGLLGEDVEKMSEEERRKLAREGGLSALAGMLTGSGLLGGLGAYGTALQTRRAAEEKAAQEGRAAQDIRQAQAAISARLGARGVTSIGGKAYGTGPDVGEQTQLEEVRPMSGLNLPALVASPAGAAALEANPMLAEMLKQRSGFQVVGADIFNRETGQFMPRPNAPVARGTAAPRGAVAPAAGAPAAGVGTRFQTLTPEQLQQANLPEGTSAQLDTQTGQIRVISAVPTQQRTGEAAKGTAVKRVDDVASRIESQMGRVRTGGPLGVVGALSRVFDSQDAKLFESYRQQLSSALRTALRIPGEGALSDFEQRQYGLQLPELGQSAENNLQILRSLQNQVRLAANLPPLEEAAQGGDVDFIFQNGRLVPVRK